MNLYPEKNEITLDFNNKTSADMNDRRIRHYPAEVRTITPK